MAVPHGTRGKAVAVYLRDTVPCLGESWLPMADFLGDRTLSERYFLASPATVTSSREFWKSFGKCLPYEVLPYEVLRSSRLGVANSRPANAELIWKHRGTEQAANQNSVPLCFNP